MSRFGEVLHGGCVTADDIQRVRDTLLFEGPDMKVKLVRFWALLTLASAIATFGLLADSVATVIGAMIVAPLMLPIMGLAFGISIGDRRAIITSILIAVGGVLTSIAVGWLLAQTQTAAFDPLQVGQITTRTSPRLIDLMAALATGLAGAFATGRKDVSDTLPGVAIAISLVPPLANVGILLASGHADLAQGSLLLFMTNYFAILLCGALVFGIMGYPEAALKGRSVRGKRTAIAIVVVMVLVISVPLAFSSLIVYAQATVEHAAAEETEAWIEDTNYRLVSAEYSDTEELLRIVIAGNGTVPDQVELRQALEGKVLGLDVAVEVIPARELGFSTE